MFATLMVGGLIGAPLPTVTPSAKADVSVDNTEQGRWQTAAGNNDQLKGRARASNQIMCGAKCEEAKASSKIQNGMTWPKY